jgi:N-alpha-acetyltransferase 10/11
LAGIVCSVSYALPVEAAPDASKLSVRLARLGDIPQIQQCNLANLPENYPDVFFQRHIYTWPELSIVAEDPENDYIVGYALGRVEMVPRKTQSVWGVKDRPEYSGHITSIAVEREYRGIGMANSLMTRLHEEFIEHFDVNSVSLHCRVTNRAAISLYMKKLDYQCTDRVAKYYADSEDAWVMTCDKEELIRRSEADSSLPADGAIGGITAVEEISRPNE